MKHYAIKTLVWVSVFSVAMGFLETAVVVYLRFLYYPDGFSFPLRIVSSTVGLVELFREAATIIMLLGIAYLAGKKFIDRFAYFILSFAVWDIFYYVFLKVILNWPESLFTWDILFLIPVPWTGPVLAPIINSFTMISLALIILHFQTNYGIAKICTGQWILLILGSLIVIFSYCQEFLKFMLGKYSLLQIFSPSEELIRYSSGFIPEQFNWTIFLVGVVIHLFAIMLITKRNIRHES